MGINLISYDSCFLAEELKMKPEYYQETHRTIEEKPLNNRDTNKIDTEVCDLKAGCFGRANNIGKIL